MKIELKRKSFPEIRGRIETGLRQTGRWALKNPDLVVSGVGGVAFIGGIGVGLLLGPSVLRNVAFYSSLSGAILLPGGLMVHEERRIISEQRDLSRK